MALLVGDIQPGSWEDLFAAVAAIQTWAAGVENTSSQLTTGLAGLQGVPTGFIGGWGSNAAPEGWLICDGSNVSRATYARLFAVLGVTYGVGNGSTTFTLPDVRGRFPLGKAASGTGNALAATGGTINHTHSFSATSSSDGAHTHSVLSHRHAISGVATAQAGADVTVRASSTQDDISDDSGTGSDGAHTHTASGTSGTGNPPYQVVNYIIKT